MVGVITILVTYSYIASDTHHRRHLGTLDVSTAFHQMLQHNQNDILDTIKASYRYILGRKTTIPTTQNNKIDRCSQVSDVRCFVVEQEFIAYLHFVVKHVSNMLS